MRKTASMLGVVATSAGLMAAGGPMAMADEEGGDGVRVLDNTNVQVAPVQVCNNNITVVGIVGELVVPSDTSCDNAPTSDGAEQAAPEEDAEPESENPDAENPDAEDDADAENPDAEDDADAENPDAEDDADAEDGLVQPQEPAEPAEPQPAEPAEPQVPAGDDADAEEEPVEQQPVEEEQAPEQPVEEKADADLPQAPAPTVIEGHLPVTG